MRKKHLPQTPKGFRDFLPLEAYKRKQVIKNIISVLELFGFEPLETPALEYAHVLEGKYGADEKLIFKFKDRGGRRLAMRYDQTVPLARVMAQHSNQLPSPFKRYQIQPAWRAEKPQAGRFRELTQCDIDIVGTTSSLADVEIITLVNLILKKLGIKKYHILFNDRRVLSNMIKASGIKADQELTTIRILDKIEKIGEEQVIQELQEAGLPPTKVENLMSVIGKRPVLPGQKKIEIPLEEIDAITQELKNFKVSSKRVLYTPTLARGLDYYTGLILEATVEGYEGGSVCGGGRYDNLIGLFAGKKIPAVGVSFGIDRLVEAMEKLELFPDFKTKSRVLVTIFNENFAAASAKLATTLRREGINTELYLEKNDKLSKQIKFANKKGIPKILIIGPDEKENSTITLKHLSSGRQETLTLEQLLQNLQ